MLGCVHTDTYTVEEKASLGVWGAPVTETVGCSGGLGGLAVLSRSVLWLPLQAREWG